MSEMHNTPLLSNDHGSETYQPATSLSNQVQLSALPASFDQSQLSLPVVQHANTHPAHSLINQSINNGNHQSSSQSISVSAAPNNQLIARPVTRPFMMSPYPLNDPTHPRLMPGQPGHYEMDGDWHDGLSDCLNGPSICMLTFCCPCYLWPSTVAKLGYLSLLLGCIYVLLALVFYTQYPLVILIVAIFPNFDQVVQLYFGVILGALIALICAEYRGKIRMKYQIDGSFIGDFCTYFWCSCCAIAQEARHVEYDYGMLV